MELQNALKAKEVARLAWAKVEALPAGSSQWQHALVLARNADADLWHTTRALHLVRWSWIRQWTERCGEKGFWVMDRSAVLVAREIFGENLPEKFFREIPGSWETGLKQLMFTRAKMDFN